MTIFLSLRLLQLLLSLFSPLFVSEDQLLQLEVEAAVGRVADDEHVHRDVQGDQADQRPTKEVLE